MTYFNGYEVHPGLLRTRATGFTDAGHALEAAKKALLDALGDDSYLGNDEAGNTFREKSFRPMLATIKTMLDNCSGGLHGVRKGLDQMADNYDKAEQASTIQV